MYSDTSIAPVVTNESSFNRRDANWDQWDWTLDHLERSVEDAVANGVGRKSDREPVTSWYRLPYVCSALAVYFGKRMFGAAPSIPLLDMQVAPSFSNAAFGLVCQTHEPPIVDMVVRGSAGASSSERYYDTRNIVAAAYSSFSVSLRFRMSFCHFLSADAASSPACAWAH